MVKNCTQSDKCRTKRGKYSTQGYCCCIGLKVQCGTEGPSLHVALNTGTDSADRLIRKVHLVFQFWFFWLRIGRPMWLHMGASTLHLVENPAKGTTNEKFVCQNKHFVDWAIMEQGFFCICHAIRGPLDNQMPWKVVSLRTAAR